MRPTFRIGQAVAVLDPSLSSWTRMRVLDTSSDGRAVQVGVQLASGAQITRWVPAFDVRDDEPRGLAEAPAAPAAELDTAPDAPAGESITLAEWLDEARRERDAALKEVAELRGKVCYLEALQRATLESRDRALYDLADARRDLGSVRARLAGESRYAEELRDQLAGKEVAR